MQITGSECENYFTETFVAVIEKYDELCKPFVAWLVNGEERLDIQKKALPDLFGFQFLRLRFAECKMTSSQVCTS